MGAAGTFDMSLPHMQAEDLQKFSVFPGRNTGLIEVL